MAVEPPGGAAASSDALGALTTTVPSKWAGSRTWAGRETARVRTTLTTRAAGTATAAASSGEVTTTRPDRLAAEMMAGRVRARLSHLPDMQRQVVTLRDVEGVSPADVCRLLRITDGNQRVVLHRGRSRIRNMLEAELGKG